MAIPFTPLTFSNNMPSGYALDENFADIKSALQSALSREHSNDNEMKVDLDMNARRILNLPEPRDISEAARLADVRAALEDSAANLVEFTPYDFITSDNVQGAIEQTADKVNVNESGLSDLNNELVQPVATFNSVSDMQADTTLIVGRKARTLGYYEPGDGGGNDYEIVAAATGTDDGGSFIDLAGSGFQAKGLFYNGVNVKQFGAVGDGVNDDTSAIASADDFSDFYISPGRYNITELSLNGNFDMQAGAELVATSSVPGRSVTLAANNQRIGNIVLDSNGQSCNGLVIDGNDVTVKSVKVFNVTSTDTSGPTTGFAVNGNDCTILFSELFNFYNSGNPNGSMPQSLISSGDGNEYGTVVMRGIVAGFLTGAPAGNTHTVGRLVIKNLESNGIYQLGGHLNLEYLDCDSGGGQPYVVKDGGTASIGTISCRGDLAAILGFQDSGDVSIMNLIVKPDDLGNSTYSLFRTRVGSSSCGRVEIGNISAEFGGGTFGLLNIGTVEYLSIGYIEATFLHDATSSPGSWFEMGACKGFNLGGANISIRDPSNLADTFNLDAPTSNLVYRSFIRDFEVSLTGSDGVSVSGSFSGRDMAQELIITSGGRWRTDFGPAMRESSYLGGIKNSVSGTPSVGYWTKGEDFALSQATAAPFRTRCTVSGTPGTWVEY